MRDLDQFISDAIFALAMTGCLTLGAIMLVGCGGVDIANKSGGNSIVTDTDITYITNTSELADDKSGVNPSCVGAFGDGFLWKPESDSDGSLVILFPSKYTVKFESVAVDGEEGAFSAFANGDRQHWRFSKSGGEYTGSVVITDQGKSCEFVVINPSERFEG